jgi:hypothetical protein
MNDVKKVIRSMYSRGLGLSKNEKEVCRSKAYPKIE